MYVTIKATLKDIFDSGMKSAAGKAFESTITKAVQAEKDFDTKKADKTSIVLSASCSVTADDPKAPKKIKAVVSVDGLLTGGAAQAFKASGNGSMDGLNPKKLEDDVTALIEAVAGDLMKDKVIPQMLKMKP